MFNRQTLFIVGAGASAEVGMPVGGQLATSIAEKLDIRFDGSEPIGVGDRSRRDQRIPVDRQPGHLRLLPTVAGHRGYTSTCAVVELEDRDCRHRQGRVAGHSGQRGCCPGQ